MLVKSECSAARQVAPLRSADALVEHYDRCLAAHGDTAKGADWPNQAERELRFDVMLDIRPRDERGAITLCDLGCGSGDLLRHLNQRGLRDVTYIGADRSALALSFARRKFPESSFVEIDVLSASEAELDALRCDYLVANGLFTVKHTRTHDEALSFLVAVVERLWPRVRRGIAFNVMSPVVDWQRDDLFHLSMDTTARILHRLAGRRVRMRADYGLYEYTAYAYKTAVPDLDASQPHGRTTIPPTPVAPAPTRIGVCRPLLPPAEALAPYLRQIDSRRIYSNNGPLALSLEERLRDRFSMGSGRVVAASSGTAALVGAVLASAGRARPERPLALVPAFTFVATAVALEQCGYQVHLLDIDPHTWMLDAAATARHPLLERVGVVVPVAPLGRPVLLAPWQVFKDQTGIAVIVDGAACFDGLSDAPANFVGDIPVALSFHATKSFGIGEGGAVATTDFALSIAVTQSLNFGFHGSRNSLVASTNGKMSEYQAAVGHAELDRWPQKKEAFRSVAAAYRLRFAARGLSERLLVAPEVASNYAVLVCRDLAESASVRASLASHEVDFRLWYENGLRGHRYFRIHPSDRLDVTDAVSPLLIGLPMSADLDEGSLDRVAAAVKDAYGDTRDDSVAQAGRP